MTAVEPIDRQRAAKEPLGLEGAPVAYPKSPRA